MACLNKEAEEKMKRWMKIVLLIIFMIGLIPLDIDHSTRYISDVVHATISSTGHLEIEPVYYPLGEYDLFMLEYRQYDTWDITALLWELYFGTGEGKPWVWLHFPSCCNHECNISKFIKFPLVKFRYDSTPRIQFNESKYSMIINFCQKDVEYFDGYPYIDWNQAIGWSTMSGWWYRDYEPNDTP